MNSFIASSARRSFAADAARFSYQGASPNMLVIDPGECIDCTLCVPECPVDAIFAEDDVPPGQREWTALNADLSKIWKPIVERKPAPADADQWAKVKEKKQLLER